MYMIGADSFSLIKASVVSKHTAKVATVRELFITFMETFVGLERCPRSQSRSSSRCPYDKSQLASNCVSRTSSTHFWPLQHTQCTDGYRGKTFLHIKIIKLNLKIFWQVSIIMMSIFYFFVILRKQLLHGLILQFLLTKSRLQKKRHKLDQVQNDDSVFDYRRTKSVQAVEYILFKVSIFD